MGCLIAIGIFVICYIVSGMMRKSSYRASERRRLAVLDRAPAFRSFCTTCCTNSCRFSPVQFDTQVYYCWIECPSCGAQVGDNAFAGLYGEPKRALALRKRLADLQDKHIDSFKQQLWEIAQSQLSPDRLNAWLLREAPVPLIPCMRQRE
jgi:hypothetical protein